MTGSWPTARIAKCTSGRALLSAVLSAVIFLACCGQAADNGGLQIEQKKEHLKVRGANQVALPEAQQHPYVPDEVLVKFKPGADAKTIERIQTELKLKTIREFSSPNLFLMKITDGTTVEAIVDRLKSRDAVKYAEPNYVVKTTP